MKAYQAHITAQMGTLLGGVQLHSSSPFESEDDAQSFLDQCVEANRQAGRHIGDASVVEVDVPLGQIIRSA
ncbi:hypothetical protein LCGC14_2529480 [marine sediment metagenome]|uniref:Uncharacterized protein n=1 Tax=marine sediment metagenome TaxID=412755 RepID=A0A0F9ATZ7_9ZZZZ